MEEGASPPRWSLDKKLGEDASMEEKKEGGISINFIVWFKIKKGRGRTNVSPYSILTSPKFKGFREEKGTFALTRINYI